MNEQRVRVTWTVEYEADNQPADPDEEDCIVGFLFGETPGDLHVPVGGDHTINLTAVDWQLVAVDWQTETSDLGGLFDTGRRKLRPTVTIIDAEGRL